MFLVPGKNLFDFEVFLSTYENKKENTYSPPYEITSGEEGLVIKITTGVPKSEIKVSTYKKELIVEYKTEKPDKILYSNKIYGSFRLSIPDIISPNETPEVSQTDGVLTIKINKDKEKSSILEIK